MSVAVDGRARWGAASDVQGGRAGALGVLLLAVLATAAGARVAVPLPWTPVPMTLQPLLVILAGALLGPRLGAASMVAYVTAGALGAPVFANGGAGLPWLLGPTGGYLLAAPAAAFVTALVGGRDGPALRTLAGLTAGVVTMYAGGLVQLSLLGGGSFAETFALGAAPFLVGDVTKILLALVIVHSRRALARRP